MSRQLNHKYVQSKVGKPIFHFIRQISYVSTSFSANSSVTRRAVPETRRPAGAFRIKIALSILAVTFRAFGVRDSLTLPW